MIIQQNTNLKFNHLYDDYFASFLKYMGNQIIIFPDFDIKDKEDKSFECDIDLTKTGEFVYDDVRYRVARAVLSKSGSIIDEINFKFGQKRGFNQLAAALQKAQNQTKGE